MWHGHHIAGLRLRLGLTQVELGHLLGVLSPKPYMVMLLDVAERAVKRNPSVGVGIAAGLATTDNPIAAGLRVMFQAAYGT